MADLDAADVAHSIEAAALTAVTRAAASRNAYVPFTSRQVIAGAVLDAVRDLLIQEGRRQAEAERGAAPPPGPAHTCADEHGEDGCYGCNDEIHSPLNVAELLAEVRRLAPARIVDTSRAAPKEVTAENSPNGAALSGDDAGRAPDPWRLAEFAAIPDVCLIASCDSADIDQRGPVCIRSGAMGKACVEHWEGIFRVLGEQASWEKTDGARTVVAAPLISADPATSPHITVKKFAYHLPVARAACETCGQPLIYNLAVSPELLEHVAADSTCVKPWPAVTDD